jgi:hypothetical protein
VRTPATLPRPLGIRLEGANGPTITRTGGICPVEESADFTLNPLLALLSRKGSPKSGSDHPHDPSMFLLQTEGAAGARGYALHSRPTKEERLMMDMPR